MAIEPKKKRVMGPRVVKDKVIYLMYKGDVEQGSMRFILNADEVFEAMDADPSLKRLKVTIPVKRKAPAPAAPTA
jgi:hypothetical protein